MNFFMFKKFVGAVFMPLPMTVLLLIIALICFARHKSRAGFLFGISALCLLLLSSTPPLPNFLLHQTEHSYAQFDRSESIDRIVVLGCGHVNDGALPITSQLHPCSLGRVVEAARLARLNPRAKIITSGMAIDQTFTNAEMNKRMLIALGVDDSRITAVTKSLDTEEEAVNLSPQLKGHRVALVTSASHMARAMRLFEQQHIYPIAAPTDHLVKQDERGHLLSLVPASANIQKSERWWYETLGQSWLTIKAWF